MCIRDSVRVERLDFDLAYPSFEEWWATQRDLSSAFAETLDGLDRAEHEEVREAVQAAVAHFRAGEDGSLLIPAATWAAAATA